MLEQMGVAADITTLRNRSRRLSAGRRYRPERAAVGRYRAGRAGRRLYRKRLPAPPRWRYWFVFEQENLLQKANTQQRNALCGGLVEIAETHREIGDVRGLGAMIADELFKMAGPGKPGGSDRGIVTRAREGLILLSCGPYLQHLAHPRSTLTI